MRAVMRLHKGQVGWRIALTVFVVITLFPVWWIVVSSLTPSMALLTAPPEYVPETITFSNYAQMAEALDLTRGIFNSIVLSAASSGIAVVLSFIAAYAFARHTFPAKNVLFMLLLLSAAIPQIATAIPLYQLFSQMGLVDSLHGLVFVIASFLTPFTVWILTSYIKRIPMEIEEAARVDGAGLVRVMFSVIAPSAAPAVSTLLVINFIVTWNELFYPLIFSRSPRSETLSLGLLELSTGALEGGVPWDLVSSLSVVILIPIVIMVALFEPMISRGLASGVGK